MDDFSHEFLVGCHEVFESFVFDYRLHLEFGILVIGQFCIEASISICLDLVLQVGKERGETPSAIFSSSAVMLKRMKVLAVSGVSWCVISLGSLLLHPAKS